MKKSLVLAPLALIAVSLLTACNNSGNNNFTNVPTCGLQGTTIMVYPKPNSLRVSPSVTNVYIASNNNTLGNGNFNAVVQPPNGLPYFSGGSFASIPASQVPVPHVKPSFPNPLYYVSNIGPLASGSTYVIGFNVLNQVCNPVGIGQFTTR